MDYTIKLTARQFASLIRYLNNHKTRSSYLIWLEKTYGKVSCDEFIDACQQFSKHD